MTLELRCMFMSSDQLQQATLDQILPCGVPSWGSVYTLRVVPTRHPFT